MNYIRIVFFGSFLFACVFFGLDMIEQAYGEQREFYVISGILNYWAVFGGFFISLIIIVYCVTEIFKRKLPSSFLNKGGIFSCIILAPLLAFALKEVTLQRTSGYVECKRLHKLTTRFSSQTYAIDNDMCIKLEQKKKAPN